MTLTSPAYYENSKYKSYATYADLGVLSMDMEISTLFCTGSLRGIRAAAISTVGGPMDGI